MEDIYSTLVELRRRNIPSALVTVVAVKGSAPREPGAKMIVKADGSIIGTVGGAVMEHKAIQEALEAMKDGEPRKITYLLHEEEHSGDKTETGMICGGEMELFIEPQLPAPTLYLFGAGHVARPTAMLAAMCGFRVELFDNRQDMASQERFPEAAAIDHRSLKVSAGSLEPSRESYAVIVTHSHETDYNALRNLLGKSFKYIGVISSRRKWKTMRAKLLDEGFSPELLDSVRSPIGLDIGSETPEEIAVSIVAELIKEKNLGGKSH